MFKTEFNNIVSDNKQLSDVQKLHYLHAALKGEAKLLENPEDTFESLFNALETRFNNKKIIVSLHIKSMFEFEKINHESAKELRNLIDSVNKNIRALNNLGFIRNELSDILITTVILDKLDRETRKQFELSLNTSDVPKFDNLMSFLEKRSQSLESVQKNMPIKSKFSYENKTKNLFISSNNSEKKCIVCHSNDPPHSISQCNKFNQMKISERFIIVKRHNLCVNCLGFHVKWKCRSLNVCRVCKSKHHHSLLHNYESPTLNESEKKKENNLPLAPSQAFASCLLSANKTVLLSSATIMMKTSQGNFIEGRCLLDSCSQINCISANFSKQLGIKKSKVLAPVSGLNGTSLTLNSKIKTVIVNKERNFVRELEFFIAPQITEMTPLMPINIENLEIPSDIKLADINFNKPGKIDCLLGAECFYELLKSDRIRFPSQNILLQETVFGYVVSGVVNNSPNMPYCGLLTQNDSLDKTLQRFWEVENVNDCNINLSNEEQFCEDHFKETHYRNSDGQYVVSMPMEDATLLGESKKIAEKRLNQLWRRLSRDSNLQLLYSNFIEEYKNLDHMELVGDSENINNGYYLPHHCVYHPHKASTALRVVFNASSTTTSGLSLNDILLKGKIPQQELISIMLRFRKHRFAFTADVQKMYRMILVHPPERQYLRILWKDSIDSPTQIYKLNTVTYGTSNAPYLATRALMQLALDERQNLPLASSVALTDFYIDDILTGESTLERAKLLQSQIIELLNRGKMQLHKWCANHPDLTVTEKNVGIEYNFDDDSESKSVKTLGVLWNPKADCFLYKLSIVDKHSYTKREVLSLISKIFDPLGLIGPVVTRAKITLQKLWLSKIDWDEPLPDTLAEEWLSFVSSLSELEKLKIPRFIFYEDRIVIHGFADASSAAYGAVIYIQSVSSDKAPIARLLCSKSRVAPIKVLSIPRLELSACVLLSKLVCKVLQSLSAKIESVNLWTDSMISLAWIQKSPHLLKTFVSNRVSTIQTLTDGYQWQHISSDKNPADLVSRGLDAKDIVNCALWWNPEISFEQSDNMSDIEHSDYEKEFKTISDSNFVIFENNPLVKELLNISNNYMKLIKILSFIFRFVQNIKDQVKTVGPISLEELRRSQNWLIREAQKSEFSADMESIKKVKQVSPKSKLKALNPFFDKDDILRVGSRIAYSQVSYNSKFPIILPAKHKLTHLIFRYFHLKYFHLGPQALLNAIRQKFWPIRGRNLARKTAHECVQCFRHKPIPIDQLMGNLPAERVNIEPPFNKSGIDFCGPFQIKAKNQRKGTFQKMYVAVFVCLATRAIHLELVSDLSTEALIATLKRFFARRGKCSTLFSDNAGNFCGARNELKKLFKLARYPEKELVDFMLLEEIEWKFIPPRAPHFGGLWEAGVKSYKTHLKKTIGDSKLTLEEFLTFTTQIEGILNSRPITPLSSDSKDLNALTPGHFLIGRPITAPIEPDITSRTDNRLTRWERVTKMTQNFWKRWQRDYLSQLHERSKWQFVKDNIRPGMIVLLKEDNLPICHWVLGKIEETVPGSDGMVRVVRVRTSKGVFKRPVHKISILPLVDNN